MTARTDFDNVDGPVADSWAASVTEDLEKSRRRAWMVVAVLAAIAVLEALALVFLLPLKTTEPYMVLVDRQTGNVETLDPLDEQTVSPDAALTRSFLVQYVNARESFDIDSLQEDYRKVSLWSDREATQRYQAMMAATNPESPLAYLPKRGLIKTEINSVSSLAPDQSLVRFTTTRIDPGAAAQPTQYWQAVINYGFSTAGMSEADRLLNPLGFQVTRYRRDAETLPDIGVVYGVQPPSVEEPVP